MKVGSPLRVAVANWSSRRVGGIEEYLTIVLPALHTAGIATAFWHESDEPCDRPTIEVPADVVQISAARSGIEPALSALRDWRPDVIYIQGLVEPNVERRLMEIAPSVRFLHTYSGTCISGGKTFTRPIVTPCDRKFGWPCLLHFFPHGCGGRSPVTMWQLFQRQTEQLQVLRGYTDILTHAAHMKEEMANHGVTVDVIPFPVEQHTNGQPTRPPANQWRLLFAARMDFLKGGHILLDALPMVAAAAKRPVTLTLAGDGPERAALEARAREIAAAGITTFFPGWVPQARVDALMEHADLLVVPSLWPEPFGSVGPAAGQHGLPVAAYEVGGIGEWLTDGINGHFAPARPPTAEGLARAIIRCLEDPQHYISLRDGAREMAKRFTLAQHLPQLISRFERVAGR